MQYFHFSDKAKVELKEYLYIIEGNRVPNNCEALIQWQTIIVRYSLRMVEVHMLNMLYIDAALRLSNKNILHNVLFLKHMSSTDIFLQI